MMKIYKNFSSKKETGVTLIEVLITTLIFAAFLTAFYLCLTAGMKSYSKGEKQTSMFRNASVGLDLIQRELKQCDAILVPVTNAALNPPNGYGATTANPFIFRFKNFVLPDTDPDKEKTIGYRITDDYKLQRILYKPGFNPAIPATWIVEDDPSKRGIRTLADSMRDLKFIIYTDPTNPSSKHLRISMTSYPDGTVFPIETEVHLPTFP